jgi:subtilase family serine protease
MFIANAAGVGLLLLQWLPFWPAPHPAPVPRSHTVCAAPKADAASCLAKVRTQADGKVKPAAVPKATVPPPGLSPADLRQAYGAGSASGHIAVVSAYNHPNAKADLDKYSTTFGLPVLPTCTTAAQAGCFTRISQRGSTSALPRNNRDWAFETSLDIEAAHAVCPTCRLTLVEADNAYISSLTTAVDRAVTVGAQVVSMSWGGDEFSSQWIYDAHFNKPGVKFVAASGDAGYGTSWPAASPNVIGAGGTSLTVNATGRASETAWDGGGSGCSRYESKPGWQHDTGCAKRTITDVAAVADPNTGAAVYSSYTPYGSGWFVVGGTSLATPVIASLMAAAGAGATPQATVFDHLYAATNPGLYDVTTGSNGACSPAYLCTAGTGYDGPTGVGAPSSTSAF